MSIRYRTPLCISFTLILLFLMICVPSAAVIAEVTNGTLLESQNEGEFIQYTIEVSGIPKQTRIIEMTTDLTPVPDTNLWQPKESGFTVSGGDGALNTHKIELKEGAESLGTFSVTVSGRVPVLTSVEIVNGVVVTKRNTQTTGYVYYRIQALDENRDNLGTGTTETFSVKIPGDEQFTARLNAVTDPDMRALIYDLYSRGLRSEATDLLEYAEVPKASVVPVSMAILVAVVLLVGGFGAGMVFGQIRAKNMQEFQKEYKGE